MRVRLTTDRVSGGVFQEQDSIVDLPPEDAKRMIAFGQAEPIETPAASKRPETRNRRG
jgi:hypothetical protein